MMDSLVLRLTVDGDLDDTFGTGGMTLTDVNGAAEETFYGVAIQQDGGIVTVGFADDPATGRDHTVVARYLGDDPLDI
jgi:hypothetical protein